MKKDYCKYIAALALKSVLYEVSATPKPGLVDRNNSGAHNDMDFYTFMASSSSLYDGFYRCALTGMNYNYENLSELLKEIRPIGIDLEKSMFDATKGINTHKGIIFSLGIISAVSANIYRNTNKEKIKAETICNKVSEMTKNISDRELSNSDEKKMFTAGEKLYKLYNIKGIRGEVESGFQTIREKGINVLRKRYNNGNDNLNFVLIQILLNIMTTAEDTNIVSRHNLNTLKYVQNYAKEIINSGGVFSDDGIEKVKTMDKIFIKKNISPGGSADLVAVTIMLGMLEGIDIR